LFGTRYKENLDIFVGNAGNPDKNKKISTPVEVQIKIIKLVIRKLEKGYLKT
jgi:hypothetical protein